MCPTAWPPTPPWSTPTSPTGTYNYDTIEFAYNKRVSQKFFINTSVDYQWRSDFRSSIASNGYDISTSPLSADPIGINYYVNANPAVPPRQDTTAYHFQFLGRYEFPAQIGFSANYRYQSGYPYSRIVPDCGCLNLSNYGADFFVEPLSNNRSDNVGLLNFRARQELPDRAGPRSRRCWTSTTSPMRTR